MPCRRLVSRRSEEHTSELQSQSNLVCRLLLEKKKKLSVSLTDSYAFPFQVSLFAGCDKRTQYKRHSGLYAGMHTRGTGCVYPCFSRPYHCRTAVTSVAGKHKIR